MKDDITYKFDISRLAMETIIYALDYCLKHSNERTIYPIAEILEDAQEAYDEALENDSPTFEIVE